MWKNLIKISLRPNKKLSRADRRLMARDGDLEAGMGSATTLKKKGSNPRGGNIQYNLILEVQVIAECVVKECLASASSSMKEEDLP
jgi:hypothetical protein